MCNSNIINILICFFLSINGVTSNFSSIKNFIRSKRSTCALPPHPEHGVWKLINGQGNPGDQIPFSTVLEFECNRGYKLSQNRFLQCDRNWSTSKIPQCEKLCPPIYPLPTTILTCTDKIGREIKCDEATDGSYLNYQCIPYYEPPFGYKKNLLCVDGVWNFPKPVCQPICGKKIENDVIKHIFGGKVSKAREYPWVAAVFQKIGGEYRNICGGSMISQKIIITAAHCVTNDYGAVMPKDEYKVAVGKYYSKYQDPRDIEVQYSDISQIIVHHGYKADSQRYLADLAILVTSKLFVINKVVQPICYSDVNNIHLHAGNNGTVAGWGVTEEGIQSDELRTLEIPYKYETTCAQELPQEWSNKYNLIDKICAGFYNKNISVCMGDSGNGLVFKNFEDKRYYIHGIVSIGPVMHGTCNFQQNTLYTKVAFYYQFIDRVITKQRESLCTLPPHPINGKWIIENIKKNPGDVVESSTVLRVICNEGYKIPGSSYTDCESSANDLPICYKLCPEPYLPRAEEFTCNNRNGEQINCNETAEGDSASYTCPEGFKVPKGSQNIGYCKNELWEFPTPDCEKGEEIDKDDDGFPVKVLCSYSSSQADNDNGIFPEDLNATMCSHLVYDYIGLQRNGSLLVLNENLELDGAKRGLYHRVADMKLRNKKLKVILRIGGAAARNSDLFSEIAADNNKKNTFIQSIKNFLQTYNFDGIELEWIDPAQRDKDNYIDLLRNLTQEFRKHHWYLAASVSSDPESKGYDCRQMSDLLEWVSIKTHDFYGPKSTHAGFHAALYPSSRETQWEKDHLNIQASTRNWINQGINKNKIVFTMAFYAKSFTLKDRNNHELYAPVIGPGPGDKDGVIKYSEICKILNSWTGVWENDQKNPYVYKDDKWFAYDKSDSGWIKGAYAKEQGFYGINIWPVDADDIFGTCDIKQILLKHVLGGLGYNVNWQ